MGALKNHPGMWMRDDAADAINALEDKHGVIRINRAGVTEREQQDLIDRWDRGDRAGLYEPRRPARESDHVKNGGEAVDIYNYTDDREKMREFGFEQVYPKTDPVHYLFRGRPGAPSGGQDVVNGVYGPNPFGIPFTGGLQKIARLYGYRGELDQNFGPGSKAGFAQFLRSNWGYVGNDELGPVMWAAIARWLRARWGYVGNDVPGPVMRAALNRADAANWNEL